MRNNGNSDHLNRTFFHVNKINLVVYLHFLHCSYSVTKLWINHFHGLLVAQQLLKSTTSVTNVKMNTSLVCPADF